MKYLISFNESIRDKMSSKSEEEIDEFINKLTPDEQLDKGAKEGLLWLVKKSFENGVDLNKKYDYKFNVGESALTWSSIYGYNRIVRFLLKNGCKPTEYIINTVKNNAYGNYTIIKLLENEYEKD